MQTILFIRGKGAGDQIGSLLKEIKAGEIQFLPEKGEIIQINGSQWMVDYRQFDLIEQVVRIFLDESGNW